MKCLLKGLEPGDGEGRQMEDDRNRLRGKREWENGRKGEWDEQK